MNMNGFWRFSSLTVTKKGNKVEFSRPQQQRMQVTNFSFSPPPLGKYLATSITFNVHYKGIQNLNAIVRNGKEHRNASATAPFQINCGKYIPFPPRISLFVECKPSETLGL